MQVEVQALETLVRLVKSQTILPTALSETEKSAINAVWPTRHQKGILPAYSKEIHWLLYRYRTMLRSAGINTDKLPVPEQARPATQAPAARPKPAGQAPPFRPAFHVPEPPQKLWEQYPVTPKVEVRKFDGQGVAKPSPEPPKVPQRKSLEMVEGGFRFSFPYDKVLNEVVKAIPGIRFETETRTWFAPTEASTYILPIVRKFDFELGTMAERFLEAYGQNLEESYKAERVELGITLLREPYDFQTVGAAYGARNERAIIGDDMGLGKTIQGIATLEVLDMEGKQPFPALVTCPKSLRLNWIDEYALTCNRKAVILDKRKAANLPALIDSGVEIFIVNYDGMLTLLHTTDEEGMPVPIEAVKLFRSFIIDEAHELRNRHTRRTQAAHRIIEAAAMPYRIPLTGTPVVNGPEDLATLLWLIGRIEEFGGDVEFRQKYKGLTKAIMEDPARAKEGPEAEAMKALNLKLRQVCFIRREKWQVLAQLPDKTRSVIRVQIPNFAEYRAMLQDLIEALKKPGIGVPLHLITALRQIVSRGKIQAGIELVESILAQGEKAVVFTEFLEMGRAYKEHFGAAAIGITGDETDEQIAQGKKRFQDPNSPVRVAVVSYKRGRQGHTLTAASKVVLHELGWHHENQNQAEDRCHRIGQKDSVVCYYLLGDMTMDFNMYRLIMAKGKVAGGIQGDSAKVKLQASLDEADEGIMKQLLRELMEEQQSQAA